MFVKLLFFYLNKLTWLDVSNFLSKFPKHFYNPILLIFTRGANNSGGCCSCWCHWPKMGERQALTGGDSLDGWRPSGVVLYCLQLDLILQAGAQASLFVAGLLVVQGVQDLPILLFLKTAAQKILLLLLLLLLLINCYTQQCFNLSNNVWLCCKHQWAHDSSSYSGFHVASLACMYVQYCD